MILFYFLQNTTRDLRENLEKLFELNVEIPRIRVGEQQTIDTLFNEEALLLAKFLSVDQGKGIPGIAVTNLV